jgi:leucyl/phenylalanyl-tRNA--protein transferase
VVPWIEPHEPLPPTSLALGPDSDAPGLLAAGAPVTVARLEEAYRRGIFPWYSGGQPPLWWSPDPRMVLPVAEFRLSHSLRKTLRRFLRTPGCEVRFDHDFPAVIRACAQTPRDGQNGTWIVPAIQAAYVAWHRAGRVHSVETWVDGTLVGGLYGIRLGRMFFGESMFAHRTDASKIALCALVAHCRARGIDWIDCQQNTGHLASFGAREVAREAFERHLALRVEAESAEDWSYDPDDWRHLGLDRPAAGDADA